MNLYIDNHLIARGEALIVDGKLAIKVVELLVQTGVKS